MRPAPNRSKNGPTCGLGRARGKAAFVKSWRPTTRQDQARQASADDGVFKDPDLTYAGPGQALSRKELKRVGAWDSIELQKMDSKFQMALARAIESGAECCATEPRTHFGTRCPVAGYARDD
jgi:hypothetical protein